MLPSILAGQLQQGLADYIKTTFPMTNPVFQDSLENMLKTKDSVCHEPYVAVRLPFRVSENSKDLFEAIDLQYQPYVHQQKAFERLIGNNGRSSLIATGTGSGKTECFLYPILEYCYQHRGEAGIKALIIYPMNALASDQAKRIAELIENNPKLKGNVNVGMYVGGHENSPNRVMGKDQVITDHEIMLSSPPDILLTNYKMLDYLLVRPKDAALWKENKGETLKYIAVDELHTFDGAQGTDLACLLRRLKERLEIPAQYLCCIGTSATMGAKNSAANIRKYAGTVFGEPFDEDAVITEDRLSASEFFDRYNITDFTVPDNQQIEKLVSCLEGDDQSAYLRAAAEGWFDATFNPGDILSNEARIRVGKQLMIHGFTKSMLEQMAGNYCQGEQLIKDLRIQYPTLGNLNHVSAALNGLFALISHARTGTAEKLQPFLTVQVQLWIRELRRLLAKVTENDVTYAIATDLNDQQAKQYLPVINCRDCGETGWVSLRNERGNLTLTDLRVFYNRFFNQEKNVLMVFPHSHENIPLKMSAGRLCPKCLQLDIGNGSNHNCSACGSETISVIFPIETNTSFSRSDKQYVCPFCGSTRGLSIIGLRSATAISASVSQMFASQFNDDKKTLAFSDNVQDAAHRAGFFNSRTWKFGLRSAIQHFAMSRGADLSLSKFSAEFTQYCHDQFTSEAFVSFLIAPNMTWMPAFEQMKKVGKLTSNNDAQELMASIEKRLNYEIMLEYGLSSQIGRTLEKAGCSAIGFEAALIKRVAISVKERTNNELGVLHKAESIKFEQMVVGFLNTMRLNGAFSDAAFYAYTNNDGKNYLLSNDLEKWRPGLQPGRNTPRFIYETTDVRKKIFGFDLVTHSKYTDWLDFCAGEIFIDKEVFEAIGKIILEELKKQKIVVSMPSSSGYQVWAINREKAMVSTWVTQLVCDGCGSVMTVTEENTSFWENAPCSRNRCGGHLQKSSDNKLGYYGKMYSSGDLVRVMAREHTGLLARDDREELERIFKRKSANKKPWDTNLLSCTPTLEMGIDIGDLSTVVMCSMPPGQAQFLQRSGRAGRKDGNALTMVVANARPHDLYFYADPMEMLSGNVEPPKIFLRASAVLERQFVAFCMDCWIKQGVNPQVIPKNVGVCLTKLVSRPGDLFPFNFLNFVQNNLTALLDTFIKMFKEYLDAAAIEEIKTFARGNNLHDSPMHMKVYEAFEGLKKQRDALSESIKQLKGMIKDLESKPKDSSYDEEIKELKGEQIALVNVVKNLNNKNIFNFLSDEGLLPNYAFPESGIVLKAILYRKNESNPALPSTKRKYEKMVYEYSRSASTAISEFAPLNNFYVDGRKLSIDQVDLTTAKTARWRLCPNCSHAQIEETGKNMSSCPQCGSPAWADSGQVRTMLKVQMVYSNMDYTKSLISDESDDRNTAFYCKQMLVDVDEDDDIVKAYRMDNDEFPFGYEFVKKATLREINFGESDTVGQKLLVAGNDEVRKGFKICKYCGKIQPEKGKPEHTFTCKSRNAQTESGEPYEECLFLYREFTTEALRILIPATTMDSTKVRQESFTAAFMLGMKEYFGNVDHLRACLSEVPVPDADYRKQYLVIYDSVPGGTGYLKQLMQNNNALIEIFEKALFILDNCSCKSDPQKDGCYHCLYAYRQSQNIGQISRAAAIRLLKDILSGKTNIEEIPKLGNIPVNSLFESELERRFVEAFNQIASKTRAVSVTKVLVNNKEGYLLKIGDCSWEIEPQVVLDNQYGVSVKSRADFVLWPVRPSDGQKPVVIFADGFLFHKDKVADDTLKREAIRRSNRFRVWSLSWKDVQSVFHPQGDYASLTLLSGRMPSGPIMYQKTVASGNAEMLTPEKAGAFELLINYLENKEAEKLFAVHARAYAYSLLEMTKLQDPVAFKEWMDLIEPIMALLDLRNTDFIFGDVIFGNWSPRNSERYDLTILSGIGFSDFQKYGTNAVATVCALLNDDKNTRTDYYEAEWNGFWNFYNVMQFLESFAGVTAEGMSNSIYQEIPSSMQEPLTLFEANNGVAEAWAETLAMIFDDEVKTCAETLITLRVLPPSAVGYELEDASGTGIAECEFAWGKEKIAILRLDQLENKDPFIKAGWTVLTTGDTFTAELFQGGKEQ